MKFHQIWQKFTFLLCGKTEISLHVEKFHVLKSEISPHGRFFLHLHVGDRGDKYQVCALAACTHLGLPIAHDYVCGHVYYWQARGQEGLKTSCILLVCHLNLTGRLFV